MTLAALGKQGEPLVSFYITEESSNNVWYVKMHKEYENLEMTPAETKEKWDNISRN